MLTVMCPNCRHQFAVPGCCNAAATTNRTSSCNGVHSSDCHDYYGGGLLVPHGYTSNGGCFVNAPTIIHGPAIIQECQTIQDRDSNRIVFGSPAAAAITGPTNLLNQSHGTARNSFPVINLDQKRGRTTLLRTSSSEIGHNSRLHSSNVLVPSECCHVGTTCDLTGGTVTITTPSIHSGGCLIQSSDSGILVQAPHIEIRPKLSGGGCLVQKQLSTDDNDNDDGMAILSDDEDAIGDVSTITPLSLLAKKRNVEETNPQCGIFQNPHPMLFANGCSPLTNACRELPGARRRNFSSNTTEDDNAPSSSTAKLDNNRVIRADLRDNRTFDNRDVLRASSSSSSSSSRIDDGFHRQNLHPHRHSSFGNVSSGSSSSESFFSSGNPTGAVIQVNATVQFPPNVGQCTVNITATTTASDSSVRTSGRHRNNFNGGGLVQQSDATSNERKDDAPTTPLSWVMPCPWGFDLLDKSTSQLSETKRLLHLCDWYHEGLSWQQSECLLRDAPIGRWLLRDSSDSRYTFAVSVQTTRGPTSVRVHYLLGRFRLDAEPGLALAMPLFDCPIKMLEYYVEYSKRMDEHREVWVDYSGELYSQIYLTKPLVKRVRSLSHLARLAVNSGKLSTECLPPLIKNYLSEYPYTL